MDTVILIDDDKINKNNRLQIVDKNWSKEIFHCHNAAIGLKIIEKLLLKLSTDTGNKQSILILVDTEMPEMDGFKFLDQLEALSNSYPNQPIHKVLLKTSSSDAYIKRVQKYNISAFITKPLSRAKLDFVQYQIDAMQLDS